MSNTKEREIIGYIDKLIGELAIKYPNMNFSTVRNNAISTFSSGEGDFEDIKDKIDAAFLKAEENIKNTIDNDNLSLTDNFIMTNEEMDIYNQLKQINLDRKKSMGLDSSKKLVLSNSGISSNSGYVSFVIILCIVLVILVALVVLVCNILI